MNDQDLQLIKEFMAEQELELLNTRAFKSSENNKFTITVGSIEKSQKEFKFKDHDFVI